MAGIGVAVRETGVSVGLPAGGDATVAEEGDGDALSTGVGATGDGDGVLHPSKSPATDAAAIRVRIRLRAFIGFPHWSAFSRRNNITQMALAINTTPLRVNRSFVHFCGLGRSVTV